MKMKLSGSKILLFFDMIITPPPLLPLFKATMVISSEQIYDPVQCHGNSFQYGKIYNKSHLDFTPKLDFKQDNLKSDKEISHNFNGFSDKVCKILQT